MIVGMIVSIPFGMIDFSSVATAQVFALPKLMPYALEFDPEVCITLAVVFPMVAIQVIGDVSAACLGSIDRMPTERELSGAIVSQGLTSMVGGLLGGLPTSALGQNVGIICSNKVVNKWVFVIIAAVFAIAGLFPQLSAVLSAIPQPVIGGATVGVFGTITMNGVRMFTREASRSAPPPSSAPPSSLAWVSGWPAVALPARVCPPGCPPSSAPMP